MHQSYQLLTLRYSILALQEINLAVGVLPYFCPLYLRYFRYQVFDDFACGELSLLCWGGAHDHILQHSYSEVYIQGTITRTETAVGGSPANLRALA